MHDGAMILIARVLQLADSRLNHKGIDMARLRQSADIAASGVAGASAEVAEAADAVEAAANSITALVDAIRAGGLVVGIAVNPEAGDRIVEKFGITIKVGTP